MLHDQMPVPVETNLDPVSGSCARSISRRSDETAECFVRAGIRVSQPLETGYYDGVVLRHHKRSTEVKLHHVGEETYGNELPASQIRNRGSGLRQKFKTRGIG
jgi:hypothetical protein